jgi:hypothetical protein
VETTTILIGDENALVGLKIEKEEIPMLASETPLSALIFFLQDKTKFVSYLLHVVLEGLYNKYLI